MKTLQLFYVCAFCFLWTACTQDEIILSGPNVPLGWRANQADKVTGEVEIEWSSNAGNTGPGEMSDRKGIVVFEAFAPTPNKEPKGNFTLQVIREDTLHRKIDASIYAVVVNSSMDKAWFLAEVTYDSKACADHGGPGESGHDEMGDCGDGDCVNDDGSDGHDAGCSGDDNDHGYVHISGKQCRVGQIVAVNVHDVSTPGAVGDRITWRWFASDDSNLPDINLLNNWQHLCKKTIRSGNLMVH